MARATPIAATPTPELNAFLPGFDLSNGFTDSLMQMQRIQMDAFLGWQKSMTDLYQELWDEWVCRFGGGAPIDV